MDTKQTRAQKGLDNVLKCDNHNGLSSQHNWEDFLEYDHLRIESMRISTLMMDKIFI